MKKIFIITVIIGIFVTSCSEKKPLSLKNNSPERIFTSLTLEEKIHLLIGSDSTYAIPRLGIPSIAIGETPSGAYTNHTDSFTIFPIPTSLASTWNTDLVTNVGQAMGNEALEYGMDVMLAPAINIHRNPLGGQNYQTYSEDPVVSGHIGAAMVRGIQSNGIAAAPKHFAVHNQQTNYPANDSRLTPRALREIYLKGFEIALKESSPWALMTAGSSINGIPPSESRGLLRTILRDEWGFDGMVISERLAGNMAPTQVSAGTDFLMTGPTNNTYNDIVDAINNGSLRMTDINRNATNVLRLISKTPRVQEYAYSGTPDLTAHAQIARQAANEGMVLLKNDNQALPLTSGIKNITAYGECSYNFIDGISTGKAINAGSLASEARTSDAAIITICRPPSISGDRTIPGDYELTAEERRLIQSVCQAYHSAGKKAIVVLNVEGVIETASWKHLPDAILLAWLPSQEGGKAVSDILSGKVNPSGKLTMTFPLKYTDVPSSDNFPWDAESTSNNDYMVYVEDIYVGYRYFDSFRQEVSYPFGFGLSYTTFAYDNAQIRLENGQFIVDVDVTNTGNFAGKEVVQLYVSAPINLELPKPMKELKAFAKTNELKPGEKQTITLKVSAGDLGSYNEDEVAWVTDSGNYKFLLGASSRDIRAMLDAEITESIVKKVNNILLPRDQITVLSP